MSRVYFAWGLFVRGFLSVFFRGICPDTCCNYIHLLDRNSELNVNQSIVKWKMKQTKLDNTIISLYEFIYIGDGAQECIGFTHNENLTFIMNMCTN